MTVRPKTARAALALVLALVLPVLACAAAAAPAGVPAASPEPQKKKKASDEKNPQAQYEMGVIALRYGLTDEAVRYGQAAVALDPGHFDGWNLLGSAYYTKGEFDLAAEAYGKAAALKPKDGEVRRNLGLALAETGRTDEAEAALKAAYAADGSADTVFFLGKLCYNAQRYEEALANALESIKNGGMTATVKQDGDAMGKANIRIAFNGATGKEWLDGTDYVYTTEDAFHCIRIPYAKITSVE